MKNEQPQQISHCRKQSQKSLYKLMTIFQYPVMSTAALFTSGATFSVAAAPLLFFCPNQKEAGCAAFLLAEIAAALQRPILSKYSAATAYKIPPRFFRFTFSHVRVCSLYSPLFFTTLFLPPYSNLVKQTRLTLWRFVVARICTGEVNRMSSIQF